MSGINQGKPSKREEPRTALVDFRQAAMDSRDANGLTADDRKGMGELAEMTKALSDSFVGAVDSQSRMPRDVGAGTAPDPTSPFMLSASLDSQGERIIKLKTSPPAPREWSSAA